MTRIKTTFKNPMNNLHLTEKLLNQKTEIKSGVKNNFAA